MTFPLNDLITPFVTVVAVVLTNQLTYGRGNREKLWELRRQAYGVILSELASVERILNTAEMHIQQNLMEYYHSQAYSADNGEMSEHLIVVRTRFTGDYLILSDRFISLFERFNSDLVSDPYNSTPPEERDRFDMAVRKWRPRLLGQARSEMPFARGWWSRLPPRKLEKGDRFDPE